ncbi:MAG: glycosyltransferase family 1 protein [Thaumarchaeota archaeon]|nr:glycosyltransferase family 1 protein [Nitrososphaerota archaeon]
MDRKIKVAFVYRPCVSLRNDHFFTISYNFFMKALQRNPRIEMNYITTDRTFDSSKLKSNFDIVLFFENGENPDGCVPSEIMGIKDLDIPVIAKIGDPWAAPNKNIQKIHEDYKIDAYFGYQHDSLFYKYYPKNYKYKIVLFGLEPSLFQNLTPYKNRIKNRILNSGAVANKKIASRILSKITKGEADPMKHYKLRTQCNELPYVDYTATLQHEFIGDKYPLLLQKYATSIASSSVNYTTKYMEIPAAGCLTFMEITEKNHGDYLRFEDGKTAIFINEKNYKDKFEEYLQDLDNPKWEKIANAGREYVMTHLNNDLATNSLVDLMEELLH